MTTQLDKRRAKLMAAGVLEESRGIPFEPLTPAGKTRLEAQNRGPFRPGKTAQDYTRPEDRPRVREAQQRRDRMQTKGNQMEENAA